MGCASPSIFLRNNAPSHYLHACAIETYLLISHETRSIGAQSKPPILQTPQDRLTKDSRPPPPYAIIESRGMEHDERQSEQISLIILDIAALILENHLLEKTIQWFH